MRAQIGCFQQICYESGFLNLLDSHLLFGVLAALKAWLIGLIYIGFGSLLWKPVSSTG